MSTVNKSQKPVTTAVGSQTKGNAESQVKVSSAAQSKFAFNLKASGSSRTLLFDKENYMWMIGGLALIFIGFVLMSGGKSSNPHEFHYDEIYSFRRITLAPIVILIGYGVEAYAIMKKPKNKNSDSE